MLELLGWCGEGVRGGRAKRAGGRAGQLSGWGEEYKNKNKKKVLPMGSTNKKSIFMKYKLMMIIN